MTTTSNLPMTTTFTPEIRAGWELDRRRPSVARDKQAGLAKVLGQAACNSLMMAKYHSDTPGESGTYREGAAAFARLAWRAASVALAIHETGRCRTAPPWEVTR